MRDLNIKKEAYRASKEKFKATRLRKAEELEKAKKKKKKPVKKKSPPKKKE